MPSFGNIYSKISELPRSDPAGPGSSTKKPLKRKVDIFNYVPLLLYSLLLEIESEGLGEG